MEGKGKAMRRTRRVFTEEFKKQVVEELLSGPETSAQLERRYGLSKGVLSTWHKRYEQEGGPNAEEDPVRLRARVGELERMVGRLAMENDFLKKADAYMKQRAYERLSIVTAKSLASRKPAGSLALPAARTTTEGTDKLKTPGSKND
jgi:transposase-like protein